MPDTNFNETSKQQSPDGDYFKYLIVDGRMDCKVPGSGRRNGV